MVEKYIGEVGKDIVLAAGGAVQGHPGGAAAGARAMRGRRRHGSAPFPKNASPSVDYVKILNDDDYENI